MAALILENWLAGRKRHVWFSVSPDLYHDARRDLDDLLAAHGMGSLWREPSALWGAPLLTTPAPGGWHG